MKLRLRLLALASVTLATLVASSAATRAAAPPTLDDILGSLSLRNIGAFRSGAWVTAIAVPETPAHDHLYTIYAASAQRRPVEDRQRRHHVGRQSPTASTSRLPARSRSRRPIPTSCGSAAATRPTRAARSRARACSSPPTPARRGSRWASPDSHHIARIVIHPKNPDIVYVAAMGHLFSKNEERGVFRTTDGGKTGRKCSTSTTASARSIS